MLYLTSTDIHLMNETKMKNIILYIFVSANNATELVAQMKLYTLKHTHLQVALAIYPRNKLSSRLP